MVILIMTDEPIFMHDAGVSAFEDAGGVASTDDDGVSFSWDDKHVVRVDAPSDLTGAFDTERFYKIEGATVARPIKQPYMVGDDIEWYKKPAEELERSAWSFDNAPFTLGHPETGMVKDVDDIHGFWRNPRYDWDSHRLKEDLYVPVTDDEAMEWIEDNSDVSVGFYNRVSEQYDGDTGDLTDDDVDGFQVDMFGNHIAGVERGRCSSEEGCGLDADDPHGTVLDTPSTDQHMAQATVDAPSGIYVADDGTWLAVAPDEHSKDSTEHPDDAMFPVDSCSDVDDAWGLRGHTDNVDLSKETLGNRIQRAAEAQDCDMPGEDADSAESTSSHSESGDSADESEESQDSGTTDSDPAESCGCNTMSETETPDEETDEGFDIPDLSVDALAEKNEKVEELREERDSFREEVDEMRTEIEDALDQAENFSVELEEDECPCEAVEELVADLDDLAEKAEQVEDLQDELAEYREDEIEDRLDTLEDLGAEREEWAETADEAEDPLDVLDEEIDRREEVLDAAPDVSVKDIESSTDEEPEEDSTDTTMSGTRTFGRGHGA